MFEKQCTKCFSIKHISNFGKAKLGLYGVRSVCKPCKKKQDYEYELTKEGLVTRMLIRQKSRSRRKGFDRPSYTKRELINWLFNQELFHKLYSEWSNSGYEKMLIPSCDRIDNTKGYSFENIKLMTWRENMENSHRDRVNGVNVCGNVCKEVVQLTLNGTFIAKYHSANEASRCTEIHVVDIAQACRENLTHKGFKWEYTNA